MPNDNNSELKFVGIDPGVSGAIAVIDCERNILLCEDFPVSEVAKSPRYVKCKDKETGEVKSVRRQGSRREFDFRKLAKVFDTLGFMTGKKVVVLESVTAMPRDSTTGAFTFGGSFWALQMALADRCLGYELVKAKTWQQKILAGNFCKDKKELRKVYLNVARKMFRIDLPFKKDAEKAAALLLAEYCRRNFIENYSTNT